MASFMVSIIKGGFAQTVHYVGKWTPGARRLSTWGTVAFATLKELAPYAAIELLLPGGSLMALTLWFYRRRKRVPALAKSLNAVG